MGEDACCVLEEGDLYVCPWGVGLLSGSESGKLSG